MTNGAGNETVFASDLSCSSRVARDVLCIREKVFIAESWIEFTAVERC